MPRIHNQRQVFDAIDAEYEKLDRLKERRSAPVHINMRGLAGQPYSYVHGKLHHHGLPA